MTLPRGRIVKGSTVVPVGDDDVVVRDERAGRLLKAIAANASIEASSTKARAEEKARSLVAEAETRARAIAEQARDEGKRAAVADLVAAWARLRSEQDARDERDLDRTIELARVMAEHLVGGALGLDPTQILGIARQVLASARQSRRVVLRAHPEDAAVLGRDLASLGLEGRAIEIQADASRTRGSLLVATDLGTIDANLPLQLDRLARSLRDSFRG